MDSSQLVHTSNISGLDQESIDAIKFKNDITECFHSFIPDADECLDQTQCLRALESIKKILEEMNEKNFVFKESDGKFILDKLIDVYVEVGATTSSDDFKMIFDLFKSVGIRPYADINQIKSGLSANESLEQENALTRYFDNGLFAYDPKYMLLNFLLETNPDQLIKNFRNNLHDLLNLNRSRVDNVGNQDDESQDSEIKLVKYPENYKRIVVIANTILEINKFLSKREESNEVETTAITGKRGRDFEDDDGNSLPNKRPNLRESSNLEEINKSRGK